ncbi:hypothetical protein PAMA_011133 [Pampus argenteus]
MPSLSDGLTELPSFLSFYLWHGSCPLCLEGIGLLHSCLVKRINIDNEHGCHTQILHPDIVATSNAAKNKAAYRIVQDIPSSDDEWLPEKNRDTRAENDEDTDSQGAESEDDVGQDADDAQDDQGAVEDGHMTPDHTEKMFGKSSSSKLLMLVAPSGTPQTLKQRAVTKVVLAHDITGPNSLSEKCKQMP